MGPAVSDGFDNMVTKLAKIISFANVIFLMELFLYFIIY
jgi:hypothetical protein